jgi:hypothetical protein
MSSGTSCTITRDTTGGILVNGEPIAVDCHWMKYAEAVTYDQHELTSKDEATVKAKFDEAVAENAVLAMRFAIAKDGRTYLLEQHNGGTRTLH